MPRFSSIGAIVLADSVTDAVQGIPIDNRDNRKLVAIRLQAYGSGANLYIYGGDANIARDLFVRAWNEYAEKIDRQANNPAIVEHCGRVALAASTATAGSNSQDDGA